MSHLPTKALGIAVALIAAIALAACVSNPSLEQPDGEPVVIYPTPEEWEADQ